MLKALIIDDDDSARLSLINYLEDLDFDIYEASDGKIGIDIIKEVTPDIILTDTHMPGLSGIEVLKFLKENNPNIPVIVISGAGEIEYVIEALRAGAWDYITKPITEFEFLSHAIEQVMDRASLINENKNKTYQLEKSLKELEETQNQLVETKKMASLGRIVKQIAHEINTPLGISMTSVSFIRDKTDEIIELNNNKKMKNTDFYNYIENNKDLSQLVFKSLMNISKLIQDFKQLIVEPSELEKKKINLAKSIESIVLFVTSSYPKIKIETKINGGDFEIESYPELFNRIFLNLAENSVIHGFKDSSKGIIEVTVNKDDNDITISFFNSGNNIPEEHLDKLFEPFFSLDRKVGSGLGLCIVYNLIHYTLKGHITFNNLPNGVVFNIHFKI